MDIHDADRHRRRDPSSTLTRLKRSLLQEVRSKKGAALFDQARQCRPPLAAHNTIFSVFAVLGSTWEDYGSEKDSLVRALILEQQERPARLWSTILVVAFYPMIDRLSRVSTDLFSLAEREGIIITAFLTAVDKCPAADPECRPCGYLKACTQWSLPHALRAERDALRRAALLTPADVALLRDIQGAQALLAGHGQAVHGGDLRLTVSVLLSRAGLDNTPESIQWLLLTLLGGGLSTGMSDRTTSTDTPAEREREYQRMKRALSRVRDRLRHPPD